ncbi:hypothetical protein AB0M36_24205 [Actinoplanes sp. NPDC051346]
MTARGEETVMDRLIAPIMYRILFCPDGLDAEHLRDLVREAIA